MAQSERRIDEFIKAWEGYRPTPYMDLAGHWTGGWGHKLGKLEPKWAQDRKYWQCKFDEDMNEKEEGVFQLITTRTPAYRFDALVSFAFNLGVAALATSTLLEYHNRREFALAGDQFKLWNKARVGGILKPVRGLTKRRAAEYNIYRNRDYSGRP